MADENTWLSSGWVLGGIGTIMATLASVVALLFKVRESENAKRIEEMSKRVDDLQKRSDKCDEDRLALHRSDAANRERISIMENMLKEIHPGWKSHKDRAHRDNSDQ
jgi:hypothetical protein